MICIFIQDLFFSMVQVYKSGTNDDCFQWEENDIFECSFRLKVCGGVLKSVFVDFGRYENCHFLILIFIFLRPKEGFLYVGGPFRKEILLREKVKTKYPDTLTLTDETRKLNGCIVDCRYFEHRWIFMKQRLDRNHPNSWRSVIG